MTITVSVPVTFWQYCVFCSCRHRRWINAVARVTYTYLPEWPAHDINKITYVIFLIIVALRSIYIHHVHTKQPAKQTTFLSVKSYLYCYLVCCNLNLPSTRHVVVVMNIVDTNCSLWSLFCVRTSNASYILHISRLRYFIILGIFCL